MSDAAGIYARELVYLDRYVQLGIAGERVLACSFPTTPDEEATDDHPLLDRIGAYVDGSEAGFADVTVALTMPTDRREVLETLREVAYGESVTVAELARMTPGLDAGDPDDVRLVREALDDNPVPLFVPDHRVADGPSGAPPEVVQKLRSIEGL
jgi:methylated-DNA-[protein]-cysteine S-methyltransferase